jgi:hypothetical protein
VEYRMILEREITPTAGDNDKAETPVVFVIKALTNAERNQHTRMSLDGGEVRVQPDLAGYFKAGVKTIKNLVVDGKPITKADDFLELPILYSMFAEIASEIVAFAGLHAEPARKN